MIGLDEEDNVEISVPVEDITGKYLLREHIGEGNFGDHEVELSVALPTGSPVVQIDGKQYVVSIHDIAKAICAAHLCWIEGG